MDVPLPAAVNESVKLAKAFGKTSAAGMVNAMLRRTAALDPKPEHWPDLEERLRTYYCLSQPIAALFAAQYPQDAEAMAAAFYQRHPTAIRVNPLRTTDEALTQTLQQEGHTVTAGPWPHCLLVMFNGNPAASKAFHAGQFHVQGLASQFAALCCDARPGMRVLDLCAAPGGKSLTIAEQMQNRGELFSGEAMTGRVKLLKQAFDRCGIDRAKPYHGDATILNPAFRLGSFDRVLCDVPCSGLGVIGKKPDIREKTLDGMPETEISRLREYKLTGLQFFYEFCIREQITDIHLMELKQETLFQSYLEQKVEKEQRRKRLRTIVETARKVIFVQADEIRWDAAVWYLDRFHIAKERRNQSDSIERISFQEVLYPKNRWLLQEYMKYEIGIGELALSTVYERFRTIRNFLQEIDEHQIDVTECDAGLIDTYLKNLQNGSMGAKTFNTNVTAIQFFMKFLEVKGYIKKVPFYVSYYLSLIHI